MATRSGKKYGNLELVRGGGPRVVALSPEEWLDRQIRAWAVSCKPKRGYAIRALSYIASDRRYGPQRVVVRLILKAMLAGASTEWAMQYGRLLTQWAYLRAKANGRLELVEDDPPPSTPAALDVELAA